MVRHDPNTTQWWAAPTPRHIKVTPRWWKMDEGDNGRVTTRVIKKGDEYSGEPISDMDYASTRIIWNAKEPNSEI